MTNEKVLDSLQEVKFKNHLVRVGDVWEWLDKTVLVLGFVNQTGSYSAKALNLTSGVFYTLGFHDAEASYVLLARANQADLSEQIQSSTQSQPASEDF